MMSLLTSLNSLKGANTLKDDAVYQVKRALHGVNTIANPFSLSCPLFDVPKDVYTRNPIHVPGKEGTKAVVLESRDTLQGANDYPFGINETLGIAALKKMRHNVNTGMASLALTTLSTGITLAHLQHAVQLPPGLHVANALLGAVSAGIASKSLRKWKHYNKEFKTPNFFGAHLNLIQIEEGHINGKAYKETLKTPTTFFKIEKSPNIAKELYTTIANSPPGEPTEMNKCTLWVDNLYNPQFHVEDEIPFD